MWNDSCDYKTLTNPHAGAVKKYIVKIYKKSIKSKNQQNSSVSRKPEKAA